MILKTRISLKKYLLRSIYDWMIADIYKNRIINKIIK